VVCWFFCRYSTGSGLSASDALIQEFYGREVQNPIHLTVDTAFTDDQANIKAYVSTPLTLGDRPLAAQFHEIQLDLRMVEAERVGCMFSFPPVP
jgi:translation initiation factor 3 subunit F